MRFLGGKKTLYFESGVFFPPNHLSFPASLRANALRTQQKINKTITTVIK